MKDIDQSQLPSLKAEKGIHIMTCVYGTIAPKISLTNQSRRHKILTSNTYIYIRIFIYVCILRMHLNTHPQFAEYEYVTHSNTNIHLQISHIVSLPEVGSLFHSTVGISYWRSTRITKSATYTHEVEVDISGIMYCNK